jgi:hypothetical protein
MRRCAVFVTHHGGFCYLGNKVPDFQYSLPRQYMVRKWNKNSNDTNQIYKSQHIGDFHQLNTQSFHARYFQLNGTQLS